MKEKSKPSAPIELLKSVIAMDDTDWDTERTDADQWFAGASSASCNALGALLLDRDANAARNWYYRASGFHCLNVKRDIEQGKQVDLSLLPTSFYFDCALLTDCEPLIVAWAKLKTDQTRDSVYLYQKQAMLALIQNRRTQVSRKSREIHEVWSEPFRYVDTAFVAILEKDTDLFVNSVQEMLARHKKRNRHDYHKELISMDTLAMIKLANRAGMNVFVEHRLLGSREFQEYRPLKKYDGYRPFTKAGF